MACYLHVGMVLVAPGWGVLWGGTCTWMGLYMQVWGQGGKGGAAQEVGGGGVKQHCCGFEGKDGLLAAW